MTRPICATATFAAALALASCAAAPSYGDASTTGDVLTSALCPVSAVVCEDFEDGNLDGWTQLVTSGALAIDSAHAAHGTNALSINIPANQRGGFIEREEELMDDARANAQPKLSYFGMTAMFPHIHPLARAGQHYYNESMACLGIAATLSVIDDDLIRHQLHSQSAEELMHFMEGKYQIDAYALTPEDQKPIEEVFDFLLRPWAPEPSRALGGNA